jgi:hypothetical protein
MTQEDILFIVYINNLEWEVAFSLHGKLVAMVKEVVQFFQSMGPGHRLVINILEQQEGL